MNPYYVYFEPESLAVKAISPINGLMPDMGVIEIPSEIGVKFITGEYNMFTWSVEHTLNGHIFVQTPLDVIPANLGELFQMPIADEVPPDFKGIIVRAFVNSGVIEVSIPEQYVGKSLRRPNADINVYMTKRNDPTVMLAEGKATLAQLITEGSAYFEYQGNPSDFSVFTNRLFNDYVLIQDESEWTQKPIAGQRINQLVAYRVAAKLPKNYVGLVATHYVSKRQIELRLVDAQIRPGKAPDFVFITKKNDPTVFEDPLHFDYEELLTSGSVTLDLPPTVKGEVGVASYPFTPNMLLIRIK